MVIRLNGPASEKEGGGDTQHNMSTHLLDSQGAVHLLKGLILPVVEVLQRRRSIALDSVDIAVI